MNRPIQYDIGGWVTCSGASDRAAIEALRAEAGAAGDVEQVRLCKLAVDVYDERSPSDEAYAAWLACRNTILDARAAHGDVDDDLAAGML